MRCTPTDKGSRVRFRISDVFLPSAEELSAASSSEAEKEGTIRDFSDSGRTHHAFAVIELDSGETIIVPVEKLSLVTCP